MLRCFRGLQKGKLRHGIWLMFPEDGLFIHGDRNELQPPRYTIADLEAWDNAGPSGFAFLPVEEIDIPEVLLELESWPELRYSLSLSLNAMGYSTNLLEPLEISCWPEGGDGVWEVACA